MICFFIMPDDHVKVKAFFIFPVCLDCFRASAVCLDIRVISLKAALDKTACQYYNDTIYIEKSDYCDVYENYDKKEE